MLYRFIKAILCLNDKRNSFAIPTQQNYKGEDSHPSLSLEESPLWTAEGAWQSWETLQTPHGLHWFPVWA